MSPNNWEADKMLDVYIHDYFVKRDLKATTHKMAYNYCRPDLKNAALARLSVVHRSLKVAKSGVKKKNKQAGC